MTKKLTRGHATISDLTAALDELGIGHGDAFFISRVPSLQGPGQARRDDGATARAAAQSVANPGTRRYAVLEAIVRAGQRGLTPEEAVAVTGIEYRTLTPRIGELKRDKLVVANGQTRPGTHGAKQQVLTATDAGRALMTPEGEIGASLFEAAPKTYSAFDPEVA